MANTSESDAAASAHLLAPDKRVTGALTGVSYLQVADQMTARGVG
jgi:hypothetical protein